MGRWLEGIGSEVARQELGPRGCGDHCGVISGERNGGEGDGKFPPIGFKRNPAAQLGVSRDAAADQKAAGPEVFSCSEGGARKGLGDRRLEAGDQVERLGIEVV